MGYYKNLLIGELDGDPEAHRLCERMRKDTTMIPAGTNENDYMSDKLLEDAWNTATTAGTELLYEQINGHPQRQ